MNAAKHTIFALMFLATTAHATTGPEFCASVGELAAKIMEARQIGVSVSRLLEIADGNKITEAMVMEAFRQSRFSSKPFIDRAIQDFRERAELECLRATRSKGAV